MRNFPTVTRPARTGIEMNVVDESQKRSPLPITSSCNEMKSMSALFAQDIEAISKVPATARIPSTRFPSGVSTARW